METYENYGVADLTQVHKSALNTPALKPVFLLFNPEYQEAIRIMQQALSYEQQRRLLKYMGSAPPNTKAYRGALPIAEVANIAGVAWSKRTFCDQGVYVYFEILLDCLDLYKRLIQAHFEDSTMLGVEEVKR